MKILFITHSVTWKGGGAFFHAFHLATQMVKLGNDVTLLSTSSKGKIKFRQKVIDKITVIESPDLLRGSARNGWDIYNAIRRILLLRNKNFDIVHCLDCRPVVIFPGLYMKYRKKIKLVIEWLDWFGRGGTAAERSWKIRIFMEPIELFFEEKFRRYADGSICLLKPLTKRLLSLGVSKNLTTILHGCDTDFIKNIPITIAKKKLNFNNNQKIIGYLGRTRKDASELFIETIKILRNKYKINAFGLFIGNTAYNIDKIISGDIKKYIIKTGWVNYELINSYLCSCDILLLPFKSSIARNNIWPSKINDYLSSGRPIIGTNLNVLKQIFNDYKIGILCDDLPDNFAKECFSLINNPPKMEIFSSECRFVAENILSWEKIGVQVNNFYKKILNGNNYNK